MVAMGQWEAAPENGVRARWMARHGEELAREVATACAARPWPATAVLCLRALDLPADIPAAMKCATPELLDDAKAANAAVEARHPLEAEPPLGPAPSIASVGCVEAARTAVAGMALPLLMAQDVAGVTALRDRAVPLRARAERACATWPAVAVTCLGSLTLPRDLPWYPGCLDHLDGAQIDALYAE